MSAVHNVAGLEGVSEGVVFPQPRVVKLQLWQTRSYCKVIVHFLSKGVTENLFEKSFLCSPRQDLRNQKYTCDIVKC